MSTTNLEALGIDPLLSIDDVATWLGKTRAALYKWAQRGYGPRPIKIGSELRYKRSVVDAWLDEQMSAA